MLLIDSCNPEGALRPQDDSPCVARVSRREEPRGAWMEVINKSNFRHFKRRNI